MSCQARTMLPNRSVIKGDTGTPLEVSVFKRGEEEWNSSILSSKTATFLRVFRYVLFAINPLSSEGEEVTWHRPCPKHWKWTGTQSLQLGTKVFKSWLSTKCYQGLHGPTSLNDTASLICSSNGKSLQLNLSLNIKLPYWAAEVVDLWKGNGKRWSLGIEERSVPKLFLKSDWTIFVLISGPAGDISTSITMLRKQHRASD